MKIYCEKCKKDCVLSMHTKDVSITKNIVKTICLKCNSVLSQDVSDYLKNQVEKEIL